MKSLIALLLMSTVVFATSPYPPIEPLPGEAPEFGVHVTAVENTIHYSQTTYQPLQQVVVVRIMVWGLEHGEQYQHDDVLYADRFGGWWNTNPYEETFYWNKENSICTYELTYTLNAPWREHVWQTDLLPFLPDWNCKFETAWWGRGFLDGWYCLERETVYDDDPVWRTFHIWDLP